MAPGKSGEPVTPPLLHKAVKKFNFLMKSGGFFHFNAIWSCGEGCRGGCKLPRPSREPQQTPNTF